MESEEKIKELVKRVLDLPIEDRLKVIDVVIKATKAEQDDFELTEEQQATIKRRIDEIESGEAKLVPLSEVKERMRKKYH
jgi:putative addiction module component (TIGR02574 family)